MSFDVLILNIVLARLWRVNPVKEVFFERPKLLQKNKFCVPLPAL
jgi:hypothetical protein